MNSKNQEDWEENFSWFNLALGKIKSHKQIDPFKLSKQTFSVNFEILQFLFDHLDKNFGDPLAHRYEGYAKRVEIVRQQNGGNVGDGDIKKYLPTHLIPNEQLLKLDKKAFFGDDNHKGNSGKFDIRNNKMYMENIDIESRLNQAKIINENKYNSNLNVEEIMEKYKNYFKLLQDDLKKGIEKNNIYYQEINEIEEERNYYMNKLENVLNLCEDINTDEDLDKDTNHMLKKIKEIISHVPEDFK